MDDRFGFLRSDDKANGEASLPIPHTFEHRVEQAQGDVALDYWPPKRGVRAPPDQITLFILGKSTTSHLASSCILTWVPQAIRGFSDTILPS